MTYVSYHESPLGTITLASEGTYLTGLWFEGQKNYGSTIKSDPEKKELEIFIRTRRWLDIYFDGKIPPFIPETRLCVTDFQKEVLDITALIPYGKTMTYGEIAESIAENRGSGKMSAQAVGNALGHNPISIIIPCHRVIRAGGDAGEYAGGKKRKEHLLKLENRES